MRQSISALLGLLDLVPVLSSAEAFPLPVFLGVDVVEGLW